MPNNHTYKIQHKYAKDPKTLRQFGFERYESDQDGEVFYAIGIKLPWKCSITTYMVKALEKIYKSASDEEKKADFGEYGFDGDGKLEITDKVKDELTRCQLCVAATGIGQWSLFINAPDHIEYYNTKTLDECVPGIIKTLKDNKAIYRANAGR